MGVGVNCSKQASLSQFFSSQFSDHFVSRVTDNLLFLNEWKREKINKILCGTHVSISGLLANEGDMLLTQLQCLMGCHGHRAILCYPHRFIFGDNFFFAFSGSTEQFCILELCPWVRGNPYKPPPPPSRAMYVCVWGGRG